VFIGSPSGLEEERKRFRDLLEKYTMLHGEPRGVTFQPVGWEDTIGGVGRPQELINEDLKQCDYAVFVPHDRRGSPTGSGYSSGTEEEWELAERLYLETKIRNIALFFKQVDLNKLHDPGPQLTKVLEFKGKIEIGKNYLFKPYSGVEEFCEGLEAHLAKWLRDHEGSGRGTALGGTAEIARPITTDVAATPPSSPPGAPGFDFWIAQSTALLNTEPADTRNYSAALFCSKQALAAANAGTQWARAKYSSGLAQFYLNDLRESIGTFLEIVEYSDFTNQKDKLIWQASAFFGQGAALAQLGRTEEEIAIYNDMVARFGTASELALREQVARALVYKGITLGQLDRSQEEIAVYDDVLGRFGTASELPLREEVSRALVNKGAALGQLDRSEEAIEVYDDVIARFGTAPELPLREPVARALVNKGATLGHLDRSGEAIAVYDDVVARFGTARELPLREQVARALVNKGAALGQLDRSKEAIAVYDDVVARFGTASELALREEVRASAFQQGAHGWPTRSQRGGDRDLR
jgi:tetratricopeptide (TPR) repeat protein